MNRIGIGTIITVAIAIIGGAVYLGQLQGQINGLDPDAIRKAKEKALKEIGDEKQKAIENLESHSRDIRKAIKDIGEINSTLDVLENSKLSNIEFKSSGCNTYHGGQHCDDKSKRVPPACPEDFGLAFRHGHTWRDGRCGGQLICGACVRLSR